MMESYGLLLAWQAYEDGPDSIAASWDGSSTLKPQPYPAYLRQLSVLIAALSLLEGMTDKPARAYSATVTTRGTEALATEALAMPDATSRDHPVLAPEAAAPKVVGADLAVPQAEIVAPPAVPEPSATMPQPDPALSAQTRPDPPTVVHAPVVQTNNAAPQGEPISDLPAAALSALAATHRSPPEALPAVETATDRAPAATVLRALAAAAAPAPLLLAQIVPDKTLPVNSQVGNCGTACTVINGGTVRGPNLFHSFQQFSIPTGGEAYFNNAAQIQNILTRVTGGSLSNIDGLIRANGIANLYLLNPNGIVFGPHASLNIGGSFVATTAHSVQFPDGSAYSAVNPQASPLLAVNLMPGVQFGAIAPGSTITNRGNLTTGQDLTLVADQLDLQGQLVAGKDLTLKAQQTLQARDSATTPLIVNAGRDLLVQGNQTVDIFALNHPDSGLFSGRNLVLRSANTVGGDAHYFAGGSLRIEQLDGSLGNLSSPHDPVIRASGDVSFDSYSGTSLHILAGGSVTVTGYIFINGSDQENGLVETVQLSNGSQLAIDGKSRPTLDIRAGLSPAAIGLPGSTPNPPGTDPNPPNTSATPTGADIILSNVSLNGGGTVFLTNQYKPNTAIFSGGNITVGSIYNSGGTVVIDSRGNISNLPSSGRTQTQFISTSYSTAPGDVNLIAGNLISLDGPVSIDTSLAENFPAVRGGNIRINAKSLQVTNGAQLNANTNGVGNAGDITINADSVSFDGEFKAAGFDNVTFLRSGAFSAVLPGAQGNGGNIDITTKTLSITNGARLSTSTQRSQELENRGNAGNITIHSGSIRLDGTGTTLKPGQNSGYRTLRLTTLDEEPSSGIFSLVERGAVGNSGNIDVKTRTLSVTSGARLSAVTYGKGHAGNVTIDATESASFDGVGATPVSIATLGYGNSSLNNSGELRFPYSGAFSSVRDTAEVTDEVRGSVTVNTPSLRVTNGARLTSSSAGKGDAGSVSIIADNAYFSGAGPNAKSPAAANPDDFPGGINIFTQNQGNGGTVNITTRTLTVNDGIVIGALTRGIGNAGTVNITADSAAFDNSFVISEVQSTGFGKGGNINIAAGSLSLTNGAQFRASTSGQGNAGNVIVRDAQTVSLSSNSSISTAANAEAIGQGGDITVETGQLSLNTKAQISASTASPGRAGNVAISTNGFEATSWGRVLTTTSSSGQAGNITIQVSDRFTLRGTGSNFNDLNDTGIYAGTTAGSTGNGGSIRIEARSGTRPSITIRDGAKIAVNSEGEGSGGDIKLTTPGRITLDNRAFVNATTDNGKGGNITIDPDLVLLRHNSQISTSAGRNNGGGDGGNITIAAGFLIGALSENSDIVANAFKGNGGNITINANSIFGFLQAPPGILGTPFSDLAASSQVGLNGTVLLNTLNLDPSQGLGELNLIPIDSSQLIAQSCATGRRQVLNENKFAVTGRSGIPASPEDVFRNASVLTELGTPTLTETLATVPSTPVPTANPSSHAIVEAQDLIIDPNGKAHLVAQAPTAAPMPFQPPRLTCPDNSSQRP